MLNTMSNVNVKIGEINLKQFEEASKKAVEDIIARAGKPGQFLNWIKVLGENQLKHIDDIFNLAKSAKQDKYTDIAILGIGGSRHTTEAMVKMLNVDSNVHFFSSVDSNSFERFVNSLDLTKTLFLVVSKSGGTMETTTAYDCAKKLMQDYLDSDDISDRFVAMTDKSAEKSKLRQKVNDGEIKLSGLVHDDVGGRFSIFDDATLFTLAFVGMSKNDIISLLNASLNAQNKFLSSDISSNPALQLAAFNVNSRLNGKIKHFVEYFGDAFQGATLWEKQLKNESLKANISTDTNVGPGYLHYNAEADLDSANKDSFFTFVYASPKEKVFSAILTGVINAYSNQHPVSIIEIKDYSVESVATLIELKHFETLYTGYILRYLNNNIASQDVALPEVLQPNVEIYKKEVRKAMQN